MSTIFKKKLQLSHSKLIKILLERRIKLTTNMIKVQEHQLCIKFIKAVRLTKVQNYILSQELPTEIVLRRSLISEQAVPSHFKKGF